MKRWMGIGPAVYGSDGISFPVGSRHRKAGARCFNGSNDSEKGTWHVYARTWNWCSPWKVKEAPGRFKIAVNGAVLDNELGMGTQWDWEYAGSVEIKIRVILLH